MDLFWTPDLFVSDVVDELNVSPIFRAHDGDADRGQPPRHPAMMVKLLVHAYCVGSPVIPKA